MRIRYWQLGIVLLVPFCVWWVVERQLVHVFDQGFDDQIIAVVESRSPEKALVPFRSALKYLERNELTTGNTYPIAPFGTNVGENIEVWYTGLLKWRDVLDAAVAFEPDVQRTVMIKIRTALVDDMGRVRKPSGIRVHPYSVIWIIAGVFGLIFFITGLSFFGEELKRCLMPEIMKSSPQVVDIATRRPAA